MPLVRVGRLGRPHGIKGEIYLDRTSFSAPELVGMKDFTWRGPRGDSRPLLLEAARPADRRMLATFAGVRSREQAAMLVQGEVWIDSSLLPEPAPGEVYSFQIVGMEVVAEDGRSLGSVAEILETGAHPVYIVRGEREVMIPAIEPFVQNVDVASRRITVRLIPGLEEL